MTTALAASLAVLLAAASPAAATDVPDSPEAPAATGTDHEAQPSSVVSPSIRELLARSARDPSFRPPTIDAEHTATSTPQAKTKSHHKKGWIIAGIVVGAVVVVAVASGGGGGGGGY